MPQLWFCLIKIELLCYSYYLSPIFCAHQVRLEPWKYLGTNLYAHQTASLHNCSGQMKGCPEVFEELRPKVLERRHSQLSLQFQSHISHPYGMMKILTTCVQYCLFACILCVFSKLFIAALIFRRPPTKAVYFQSAVIPPVRRNIMKEHKGR